MDLQIHKILYYYMYEAEEFFSSRFISELVQIE